MAYPKLIKPARTYPANVIHAIRIRINQAAADPGKGERALTLNKPVHVGTIPAGSVILPALSQVKTLFAPTATINIGSETVPGGIMPTATIAPGTAAIVPNVTGTLSGTTDVDIPVWILMGTATATAGVADFTIPFYVNRD